ncbi:MAG: hypothetical protein JNL10_11020 [Verrucomicrobiales bacterium]|nr:hypothetical protein [Verrucomicrobiales bacterium]
MIEIWFFPLRREETAFVRRSTTPRLKGYAIRYRLIIGMVESASSPAGVPRNMGARGLRRLGWILTLWGCTFGAGLEPTMLAADDDPLPPLPPVTVPADWSAWRGIPRLRARSVVDYSSAYQKSTSDSKVHNNITEQVTVHFTLVVDEDSNISSPSKMHWRVTEALGSVSRFESFDSESSSSQSSRKTTSQGSYSGPFSLRVDPHLSLRLSDGTWDFVTLHELASPMVLTTSGYADVNGEVTAVSDQIQVTTVSDTVPSGVAPRLIGGISGSGDDGDSTGNTQEHERWTRTGRIEFWPDRSDVEVAVELQALSDTDTSFLKWRPEGNVSDASAAGPNPLLAKATLRPRTPNPTPEQIAALPLVRRFRFEMRATSKEPGVCMNWPILASVPEEDPDYDLRFAVAIPGKTVLSPKRQKAGVEPVFDAKNQPTASVRIDCHDFGATSELAVIAELADGTELVGALHVGEELRHPILIPDRDPGTRIARVWRTEKSTEAPDAEDGDDEPVGDGQDGDGFSVWEEYRGFRVAGKHETLDPAVKELFLVNEIGPVAESGIRELEYITQADGKRGLRIYDTLRREELPESRVMNLNRGPSSPRTGTEPQTGVTLEKFRSSGKLKVSFVDIPDDKAYRPKNTKRIVVNLSGKADELTRTVAHEIAHCIGAHHHGETDPGAARWEMGSAPLPGGGMRYFFSERLMALNRSTGKMTNAGSATEIRLFSADRQTELIPGIDGPALPAVLWVAARGGQHSGVEGCVMRYTSAEATAPFGTSSKIRIHTKGLEFDDHNYSLCTDCRGTGINDVTSEPNLYAHAFLGDCLHQLCVRDSAPVRVKKSSSGCADPGVTIP